MFPNYFLLLFTCCYRRIINPLIHNVVLEIVAMQCRVSRPIRIRAFPASDTHSPRRSLPESVSYELLKRAQRTRKKERKQASEQGRKRDVDRETSGSRPRSHDNSCDQSDRLGGVSRAGIFSPLIKLSRISNISSCANARKVDKDR